MADELKRIEEEIRKNLASVVLEPLKSDILAKKNAKKRFPVIIVVNQFHRDGVIEAKKQVVALAETLGLTVTAATYDMPYVFATLTAEQIWSIVRADREQAAKFDDAAKRKAATLIHNISLDHEFSRCLNKSVCTVKADAAWNAYDARGGGVVWAVLDSGVDKTHVHFAEHKNLELPDPLVHRNFVLDDDQDPLTDPYGHGSHVAGIIAGAAKCIKDQLVLNMVREEISEGEQIEKRLIEIDKISGVAPLTKILSLRVLNNKGTGRTQAVIQALQYINELNQNGRRIRIHGANLSLGYVFDPTWYACGQSLICAEVNRLVKSGVMVVISAGNTGYGKRLDSTSKSVAGNFVCSINDPGNAEFAMTIGSTHRDMPHTYGVSYFSSKGPTGDGRMKPDLVAPGERIVSCLSNQKRERDTSLPREAQYIEDSGTSMAAPHVSGAVAALLSVREEFKGQPERVKQILLNTALDLQRERYFQGYGLINLMSALQSC
jgi:subtilisin family serine protease